MSLVKCVYSDAKCKPSVKECEGFDACLCCKNSIVTDHYIEGNYKKISFERSCTTGPGSSLKLNNKIIYDNWEDSVIDYLVIDGNVYIDKNS